MLESCGRLLRTIFLFSILLVGVDVEAASGLRERWTRDRGGGNMIDAKGDIIQEWNGRIWKYSGVDGSFLWSRFFEIPGYVLPPELDKDGNAVLAGVLRATNEQNAQVFLAKVGAETGESLWEKTLVLEGCTNVWTADVKPNGSGEIFVLAVELPNEKGRMLKFTDTGELRWNKDLGELSGGVLAIGTNEIACVGHRTWDLYAVKVREEDGGTLTELQTHLGTNDVYFVTEASFDRQGGVAFTGQSYPASRIFTGKISGAGELLWVQWKGRPPNLPGGGSAGGRQLMTLADGDVVVLGRYFVGSPGVDGGYLARYNGADGVVKWGREFGVLPEEQGEEKWYSFDRFAQDWDGNLILPARYGQMQSKLYKVDIKSGELIWDILQDIYVWAAHGPGVLVLSGDDYKGKFSASPEHVFKSYSLGPELRTRVVGDEMEVGWESENLGLKLERLKGGLESGEWLEVEGSTATNLVRVPRSEGTGMFRLVTEF